MFENKSGAFACEMIAGAAEVDGEIVAGYGSCRSCNCTGYKKKKSPDNYCANCEHHYSQHR